jgi:GPI-anchor transamidase subunit K
MALSISAALCLSPIFCLTAATQTREVQTYALIVSGSRFWFNYRHTANALAVYNIVKESGVPDNRILLGLSEDHSSRLNNRYFGTVFASDNESPMLNVNSSLFAHGGGFASAATGMKSRHNLYRPSDTEVDLLGSELTASTILGIISGRERYGSASSQRFHLSSAEDDSSNGPHRHLLLYLTGHGGDGFLKLSDKEEITSVDLAQAVASALRSERFHTVTALFDTCQAATLHEHWYTPGILAFSSSVREQNSYAYGIDDQPTLTSSTTTAGLQADFGEGITIEQVSENYRLINRKRYYPGGVGQSPSDGFTRLLWDHLSATSPASSPSAFASSVSSLSSVGPALPWKGSSSSGQTGGRNKFLSPRDILLRQWRAKNRKSPAPWQKETATGDTAIELPSSSPHHHHQRQQQQHTLSDVINAVPGWRIGSTVTEHTATMGTGALEAYYKLSLETHGLLHPPADMEQHSNHHQLRLLHQAKQLASSLWLSRSKGASESRRSSTNGGWDACEAFWCNEEAFRQQYLSKAHREDENRKESAASVYVHSLLQCEEGPPKQHGTLPSATNDIIPTVASASYLSKCRDDRVALAACLHNSLDAKLSAPRSSSSSFAKASTAARGEVLSAHEKNSIALSPSVGKALLQLTAAEHIFGDSSDDGNL